MFRLIIISLLAPVILCSTCESPKYSSSGFSTLDGFFHFSTTYIVEFTLQCANNARDIPFYAVINGKSYHVAASEETSKYQVSWQLEHAESSQQTFNVKIYDEDKFSAYKKAERSGEDADSAVEPLFTLTHYHAGISKKWPVSPETVYLLLAGVAVYYVMNFKNQFKN